MEEFEILGNAMLTIQLANTMIDRWNKLREEIDDISQKIFKIIPNVVTACDFISCTVEDQEQREELQKMVAELKKIQKDIELENTSD